MTPRLFAAVTALCIVLSAGLARAQAPDFNEYASLLDQANAAHDALDAAPAEQRPALSEDALARDLAVIQWLDAFFATDAFAGLSPDQQALAYRDRYRTEYNAAHLLIDLNRCGEARDRVGALLSSPANDAELRPRLTEVYDQAVACDRRTQVAILQVATTPENAALALDGQDIGPASAPHTVALGAHTLVVSAPDYASETLSFEASEADQVVSVGPVELIALARAPSRAPTVAEWTLWGLGTGALATGLVLWVSGLDRQSQIDSLASGLAPAPGEQDLTDRLILEGLLIGGAGLAMGVVGTVLYLTGGPSSPPSDGTASIRGALGPTGAALSLSF
jgi:hypothetical protein